MKILDIITENATPGTTQDAIIANWLKNNPNLQVVERVDPKTAAYAETWIEKNKRLNADVAEKLAVRYGPAFTFFKVIGFAGPLILCIMQLLALEAQAKEKDSEGNYIHSLAWVKGQENAIVGLFVTSQLLPIIARSIAGGAFVGAFRNMLSAVAIRSPGGARASIVALLAVQAATVALQIWMNTPEGKDWCTRGLIIPLLIGGIGALSNIGLEFLREKIKAHTGVDVGIVTPTVNQRKDDEKASKPSMTDAERDAREAERNAETRPRSL